jgi:hypothetical protein
MANYLPFNSQSFAAVTTSATCRSGSIFALWLIAILLLVVSVRTTSGHRNAFDHKHSGNWLEIETLHHNTYPRIIHQVWLGFDRQDPPDSWRNGTNETIRNNPDFTYHLWSKDDVINLLTSHYPWFLPIYHSYPYNIERADAARYFIILHYGGIYLDMDEVSVVSISDIINDNKLQRYQCFLPQGTPNGITNYVIMCKRNSPFMRYLTSQLALSKGWYGIPYATVMWSTGPRLISRVYDSYGEKDSLFIMPGSEVRKNFRCLFGQSWFRIDGVIIHVIVYPFIRMGLSWSYMFVIVTFIVLLIVRCFWKRWKRTEKLLT